MQTMTEGQLQSPQNNDQKNLMIIFAQRENKEKPLGSSIVVIGNLHNTLAWQL